MKYFCRSIALGCALLFASIAASHVLAREAPVRLDEIPAGAALLLGNHVSLLEDAAGTLDWRQAAGAARADQYRQSGTARPNLGYTRSAYWVRFTADPGGRDAELLLDVAVPTLDVLDVYLPTPDRGGTLEASHQTSGDSIPWSARSQPFRSHVFRLPLKAGVPQTVYLRVQTSSLLILPMTLWRAADYRAHDQTISIVLGVFYGLVLGLFLYNLMLYVALRDRIYLFYTAYVAAFGLALTSLDGMAFAHLWPRQPWWANQAHATLLSIAHCAGMLFARDFLDVRRIAPRWYRVCTGYAAAFALLALCGASGLVLDQGRILQIMAVVSPAGAVLTLMLALLSIRAGYRPARFFLLAWSALLLFIVQASLRNFGIGPDNTATTWGLHTGLALDVILLSTALADRINLMQSGVVDAQRQLIDTAGAYQAALERRTAELSEANRELESFSYTVAHDLRAPLRAIEGFSRMVEMDSAARLAPEARADLLRISQNARHMAVLIDALLEFSRLGRHTLSEQQVDMRALADAALADALSGSRAVIDTGALDNVMGDAALLRQVWSNLIGNAFKYSAKSPAPRIEVRSERSIDEIIFSVRDNGAGFDPAYAGKLFNMFQRLHTVSEFEGAGIGLALVKRIVERHGGRVWAEGQPGSGACFWFALPLARLTVEVADQGSSGATKPA